MSLRAQIADIVERHLDEIVDATVQAYIRDIPSVATAPPEAIATIRRATMRATRAFLAMYADPDSAARQFIQQARSATVERAGEVFAADDISEMIRIGRTTVYQTARRFTERELIVSPDARAELQQDLDAFLTELERSDELVTRVSPDALHEWLSATESEEPDIR